MKFIDTTLDRARKLYKLYLHVNPIDIVNADVRNLSRLKQNQRVTVLDLGYGKGLHWESLIANEKGSSIEVTGVDVNAAEVHGVAKNMIIASLPEGLERIQDDEFDIVIAFDLIEHLSKEDGYILVYHMKRIARQCAFIFTPNGHIWQPPTRGNPYQAHISGWTPREFNRLGWKSRGIRGLKFWYGPLSKPRVLDESVIGNLSRLPVDLLAKKLPSLSFSFIAKFQKGKKWRQLMHLVYSQDTSQEL